VEVAICQLEVILLCQDPLIGIFSSCCNHPIEEP
jgi:hypothetical protein